MNWQSHWKVTQTVIIPIDDKTILMFLRGCKFSLERTKEKLDMFFSIKTLLPEFFENGDPMHPKNLAILRLGSVLFFLNWLSRNSYSTVLTFSHLSLRACLPVEGKYDAEGRKIMIMRAAVHDPEKIKQENIFRVNCFIMDIVLHEVSTDRFSEYSVFAMNPQTLSMQTFFLRAYPR